MFIRLATGWSVGRLVRNIKMQQIFRYVIIPERNGTARRVASLKIQKFFSFSTHSELNKQLSR